MLGVAAWRYASQAPPLERPEPVALHDRHAARRSCPAAAPDRARARPTTRPGAALLNAGDLGRRPSPAWARRCAAEPENAEYQNVLGHALWRSGDREAALAAHAEAARLDPRLQMQYARVAGRGGARPRRRRGEYEEILAESPDADDRARGPGPPALPQRRLREGRLAPAAGRARRGPTTPSLQQELAYSLDRPGDREAGGRGVPAGARAGAPGGDRPRAPGRATSSSRARARRRWPSSRRAQGRRPTPRSCSARWAASSSGRAGPPRRRPRTGPTRGWRPNAPDARELAARAARLEATGGAAMSARRVAVVSSACWPWRCPRWCAAQGLGDAAARERREARAQQERPEGRAAEGLHERRSRARAGHPERPSPPSARRRSPEAREPVVPERRAARGGPAPTLERPRSSTR